LKQTAVAAALVLGMIAFGVATYSALGSLRGTGAHLQRPSSSLVKLPGSVYLAQGGALYRLQGGAFKQITPEAGWGQPAASPDGTHLVAVKRSLNSSDIYLLGTNGQVDAQLTHNSSNHVERNHWAFYPRFSPDGATVFFSYDAKDPYNTYRVDLSIYSRRADAAAAQSVAWSQPNPYTGGDVGPVPLRRGLIFTRYSIDARNQVHSQIWLQAAPGSPGVGLTAPADDCTQPTVSPDGRFLAMVCRHGQPRTGDLAVAPLELSSASIGAAVTLVHGELVASPSFSADGSAIAYLAPAQAGGQFQLWTVAWSPAATPGAQRQVTQNLGFDPTSSPVWFRS
jgi:Tol biopolymer transport system component